MNTFVNTGQHGMFITTDYPGLKAIEQDNGITWQIMFYVDDQLIDTINMEHPIGSPAHKNVLAMPVYDSYDEHVVIGTVKDRLTQALDIYPKHTDGYTRDIPVSKTYAVSHIDSIKELKYKN